MAKVLVADDEPTTVEFIQTLLRAEGHDVDTAADGDEALRKARFRRPDVLVTDLRMPGLNGNQLTAAVRGLDRLHYVFILVLTSSGEKADKLKAMLSGADDFLVKPARPGELLGRIDVGLRLQKAETEARAAAHRKGEAATVFRALAAELDLISLHLGTANKAIGKPDPPSARRAMDEAAAVAQRAAAMTRIRAAEAEGDGSS